MSSCPEQEWTNAKVGDLFAIHGATIDPSAFPAEVFEYYSLPAWDLTGGPELATGRSIESGKTLLVEPTILVSKLNPRKPRVVLATGDSTHRRCASTEFIPFVAKERDTDLGYFRWYFGSPIFQRRLERVAIGSTNSHVRATPGETLHWSVRVPPPHEQRRVTAILDTLDEAIRKTEGIIAKLRLIKQGLLHDLLSRGIDQGGQLRPSPTDAPHLYAESPLGTLPVGLAALPLKDACALIKDGTHLPPRRVDDGPLLLSVRNMQDGSFGLTPEDTRVSWAFYRSMHRGWSILEGDVLLAIVGATLGKSAIVPALPPFTLQRSVAVMRGRIGVVRSSHLKLCIDSTLFQTRLWQAANQTAQPGVYLEQLGLIRIPCPSFEEQERIEVVWQAAEARLASEVQQVIKLRLLKRGLADDLLCGRVRVPAPEDAKV